MYEMTLYTCIYVRVLVLFSLLVSDLCISLFAAEPLPLSLHANECPETAWNK